MTPAMAAGLTSTLHDMNWLAELIEKISLSRIVLLLTEFIREREAIKRSLLFFGRLMEVFCLQLFE